MIEVWDKKKVNEYMKWACAIEASFFKRISEVFGEDEEYVVLWMPACGQACDTCSCTLALPAKIFRPEFLRALKGK